MAFKIYFKNIDTDEDIQKPMSVNGNDGESYRVKKMIFDQYRLVEQTAPLTGTYSKNNKDITLYYRRRDWVEGQQTNLNIKLFEDTNLYADTDIDSKKKPATADSTYQIIMRVVTPDGSFWYRTDENDWIQYNGATMELLDSDDNDQINQVISAIGKQPTDSTFDESQSVNLNQDELEDSESQSKTSRRKTKAAKKAKAKLDETIDNSEQTSEEDRALSPELNVIKESIAKNGDDTEAVSDSALAPTPTSTHFKINDNSVASPTPTTDVQLEPTLESEFNQEPVEPIKEPAPKPKKKLRNTSEYNGRIDFVPNKYTTVFDMPYGIAVDKIRHDAKVKIVNRVDEPGITWFKLDGKGWITSLYVKGL